MGRFRTALLIAAGAFLAPVLWFASVPAPPLVGAGVVVPNSQSMLGVYNVRDHGATGNGTTDDTAAIQSALTAAAGGAQVIAPPGKYLVAGRLAIPDNVSFLGPARVQPTYSPWSASESLSGATLLLTGGAGSATGTAAITLGNGSVISGFTVYHPNQSITAATPTAYPFAIAMGGSNGLVDSVELVNAYQGIYAGFGRSFIRHVFGQPLAVGIKVENSQDTSRFEDIHFWPTWESSFTAGKPSAWVLANGFAYSFGRSDEQYCRGLMAVGYNRGFNFYNQASGLATGTTYGQFSDCSVDLSTNGIVADCSPFGVTWSGGGLAVTGSAVFANTGALHLSGVRIWSSDGSSHPGVTHNAGTLSFAGCRFKSQTAVTAAGSVFAFNGNILDASTSTIAMSGAGKATLVGNTTIGASFASILSGAMSGGTVTGNNN